MVKKSDVAKMIQRVEKNIERLKNVDTSMGSQRNAIKEELKLNEDLLKSLLHVDKHV